MLFFPTAVSLQAGHGCISARKQCRSRQSRTQSAAGWAGEAGATNASSLLLPLDTQPLISQGRITSADGVSREARHSIRLPTAQCMKFLSLRNENEVLEGGELLRLVSEPGCAASASQLACRAGLAEPGQARQMRSTGSLRTTHDLRVWFVGFFPHFTTGKHHGQGEKYLPRQPGGKVAEGGCNPGVSPCPEISTPAACRRERLLSPLETAGTHLSLGLAVPGLA